MSLVSEAMMRGEDKTLTRLCEQTARENLHAMVQEAVGLPITQRQLQAEAQKHWYEQEQKAFGDASDD